MPQIKLLRNPSRSFRCPLVEGETGSVHKELADTLIAMGIAEPVATPREIKGVPDTPTIAGVAPVTREAETESTLETKSKPKKP